MSSVSTPPNEALDAIETPELKTLQETQTQENQSNDEIPFVPKSIVLAKVKGYPPWPAMVLEESLLPENILTKKPKSVKQPSKKKLRKPIFILPVRFFSDDTYIWIKSNEVKPLSHEMISQFLLNDKKRKDNLLQTAYELANDPPDMELFIKWGSKGEPVEPPYVEQEEEEEEEEEVDDEMDLEEEEEEEEEEEGEIVEDEDEEEEDYEEPSRKKQKKNTKTAKNAKSSSKKQPAKKSSKVKPAPKVDPREEGYDSDWGLNEAHGYNKEEGNYIFDNEQDQIKFEDDFPSAASLSDKLAKYHNQFDKLDLTLTDQLLSDSINESEILQNLKKLDTLKLPKAVYIKSKVLKTLILTLRRPSEIFPHPRIRKEVRKIVHKWADLDIEENTLEDMEAAEEDETTQEPEADPKEEQPQDGTNNAEGHTHENAESLDKDAVESNGPPSDANGVKSDSFNADSFVTA